MVIVVLLTGLRFSTIVPGYHVCKFIHIRNLVTRTLGCIKSTFAVTLRVLIEPTIVISSTELQTHLYNPINDVISMHSNHFGIYRTFHLWRGVCSHSTRIESDSGVFLRWYHVMSTYKANTQKGCSHWSCSSHVCNDHIFFRQHWPCMGTYTVQSKTEIRSFTEVTMTTTGLKGTVVTIFTKNFKMKRTFFHQK